MSARSLGRSALAGALLVSPLLVACPGDGVCDTLTGAYASDVAPITLAAGRVVSIPLTISAPSLRAPDGGPALVVVDFELNHCAAAPVTQGPDTRAMGSYQLLHADGSALSTEARPGTIRTIEGWCLARASIAEDDVPHLAMADFDCSSGTRCTASLRLDVTPSVNVAADEISARLRSPGPSFCARGAALVGDATIDVFGP